MTIQETQELVLSSGLIAVIVSRMTGRQKRAVSNAHLKNMSDSYAKVDATEIKDVKAKYDAIQSTNDAEDELIRQCVILYDGTAENIVDRLLDAESSDLSEVVEALKKVQAQKKTPTQTSGN